MEKIVEITTKEEARSLFGLHDHNIKAIEKELRIKITLRGDHLKINGLSSNVEKATRLIEYLLEGIRSSQTEIGREDLHYLIKNFKRGKSAIPEKQGVEFNAAAGKDIPQPIYGNKSTTE